ALPVLWAHAFERAKRHGPVERAEKRLDRLIVGWARNGGLERELGVLPRRAGEDEAPSVVFDLDLPYLGPVEHLQEAPLALLDLGGADRVPLVEENERSE